MKESKLIFNDKEYLLTFIGDIHGEFKQIVGKICKLYQFQDSVNIVCGDIGMGFCKDEYYDQELGKLNKLMKKSNNYLIMLRGNHDDPKYFNSIPFQLSNIICIPDYSIVEVNNLNILCIGGAISVDRGPRIINNRRAALYGSSQRCYWENEHVTLDTDKLDTALQKPIHILATHTTMSWSYPQSWDGKSIVADYIKNDDQLEFDLKAEKAVMDAIWVYIQDKNIGKLTHHYYGHFHQYKHELNHDCFQILLDCNQIYEHKNN